MRTYTYEFRKKIVDLYNSGESVLKISGEYCIPRNTVYRWINQSSSKKSIKINIKNSENKLDNISIVLDVKL